MKRFFLKTFLILSVVFAIPSCDPFPEQPKPDYQEELKQLLPSLQYLIGYFNGTDHSRFQLIWSQQLAGVRGTHLAVDKYEIQGSHTQEFWEIYFLTTYPNLDLAVQYASEINSTAYRGIARLLFVLNLGIMTDVFGDMPHTLALSYFQGLTPHYDEQSLIYEDLMEQFDLAIADLEAALTDDSFRPGPQEDLIYGGDINKWLKAAHTLKLRYMLRIAHQANDYETMRLNILPPLLFTGNQDDFKYEFIGNQQNLYFIYDNDVRNTRMGKFFVDKLIETDDPRLPVFVKKNTTNNEYIGSAPGQALLTASFIGAPMASARTPASFMTYVEQKFIEAEVYQRTGFQDMADQAFSQAVKASLQKHNVSNPEWEAVHADIQNVTLEQIINAKYIALFLNPEVWSDYRRTGFPQLPPYQQALTPEIPRRFVYPAGETAANPHTPPNVGIYTRMWWDVER